MEYQEDEGDLSRDEALEKVSFDTNSPLQSLTFNRREGPPRTLFARTLIRSFLDPAVPFTVVKLGMRTLIVSSKVCCFNKISKSTRPKNMPGSMLRPMSRFSSSSSTGCNVRVSISRWSKPTRSGRHRFISSMEGTRCSYTRRQSKPGRTMHLRTRYEFTSRVSLPWRITYFRCLRA